MIPINAPHRLPLRSVPLRANSHQMIPLNNRIYSVRTVCFLASAMIYIYISFFRRILRLFIVWVPEENMKLLMLRLKMVQRFRICEFHKPVIIQIIPLLEKEFPALVMLYLCDDLCTADFRYGHIGLLIHLP